MRYVPPLPRKYIYDEKGLPRYNPKCSICGRYLSVDYLLKDMCYDCELIRKSVRQEERQKRLSKVKIGLNAVLKRRITSALSRSFRRERQIEKADITMNYILGVYDSQNGLCALTGRKLSLGALVNAEYEPDLLSIDRINPKRGYIKGNIQLTTLQANKTKERHTNKELLDLCKDIVAEAERNPSKFEE